MQEQYFHKETIEKRKKELEELFDLNFGKDWRIFIILFFSLEYGTHSLHYQNPTKAEAVRFKNRNFAGQVRKSYYFLCRKIMEVYFTHGKEEAVKLINEDKFRFKWYFKKDEIAKPIISDELYNLHNGITPFPAPQQKKKVSKKPRTDLPTGETLEDIYLEITNLDEKIISFRDKRIGEGLSQDEQTQLNELTTKKKELLSKQRELEIKLANSP